MRLDRTGALAAGRSAWLHRLAAAFAGLGLHLTEIPRRAAVDLAPGLAEDLDGVLFNREDWRLDPRAALGAMRAAAEAAGVKFHATAVAGRGEADLLVLAAGAAPGLAGIAPETAALSPIKGHILRARMPELGGVTVRGEGGLCHPGRRRAGGRRHHGAGVADARPDPAKAGPLLAAGATLFPALAGAAPELLAGLRAATPDGLPLVGFSQAPGVLLATGARRNGWLLAPLVGQVAGRPGDRARPRPLRRAPGSGALRLVQAEADRDPPLWLAAR